jgi:hypothetical protein
MVINNRDDVKTMWIFTSEKKLDWI